MKNTLAEPCPPSRGKAFRILMVDDHAIFRLGLRELIRSHAGWEVCGEAVDGRQAVAECRRLAPDLVILDICLPLLNGVDAARQMLKENPAQAILVLTAVEAEDVICECLVAGIRGWLFKSEPAADVRAAIEAMQRRRTIFNQRVSALIMDGYKRYGSAADGCEPGLSRLTAREREVLQLVSEGKASKEIATMLHLSLATAETHRSNILRKLRLHSTAELVLYAVRNGIVHVQLPPAAAIAAAKLAES
jgi:DNA-binding NarL/FixJ family response regulator